MTDTLKFKYTAEKCVLDAAGVPIRPGSVLAHVSDAYQGVVKLIIQPHHRNAPMFSAVGDLIIRKSACYGTERVTNCYHEWLHVPHEEQTYQERYRSWLYRPSTWEGIGLGKDESEHIAMEGILSLLPKDTFNMAEDDFPQGTEEVLGWLADHIDSLLAKNKETDE